MLNSSSKLKRHHIHGAMPQAYVSVNLLVLLLSTTDTCTRTSTEYGYHILSVSSRAHSSSG
jgi:hypothetical protein